MISEHLSGRCLLARRVGSEMPSSSPRGTSNGPGRRCAGPGSPRNCHCKDKERETDMKKSTFRKEPETHEKPGQIVRSCGQTGEAAGEGGSPAGLPAATLRTSGIDVLEDTRGCKSCPEKSAGSDVSPGVEDVGASGAPLRPDCCPEPPQRKSGLQKILLRLFEDVPEEGLLLQREREELRCLKTTPEQARVVLRRWQDIRDALHRFASDPWGSDWFVYTGHSGCPHCNGGCANCQWAEVPLSRNGCVSAFCLEQSFGGVSCHTIWSAEGESMIELGATMERVSIEGRDGYDRIRRAFVFISAHIEWARLELTGKL